MRINIRPMILGILQTIDSGIGDIRGTHNVSYFYSTEPYAVILSV